MKEVLTQEYRVWRDRKGNIERKEPTRQCKISPIDIQRMNKQMYKACVSEGGGGAEYYFEAVPEKDPMEEMTRGELVKLAQDKGLDVDTRGRKADIIELIKNEE